MPLTQKDIDELKGIHRREFGEEISNDEAWEMGTRLLRLFEAITRRKPSTPDKSSNRVRFD